MITNRFENFKKGCEAAEIKKIATKGRTKIKQGKIPSLSNTVFLL